MKWLHPHKETELRLCIHLIELYPVRARRIEKGQCAAVAREGETGICPRVVRVECRRPFQAVGDVFNSAVARNAAIAVQHQQRQPQPAEREGSRFRNNSQVVEPNIASIAGTQVEHIHSDKRS